MFNRFLSRFQPDGFVLALIGTVAVSTFLPCRGTSAEIFHALGSLAVAALFFCRGRDFRARRWSRERSIGDCTRR
jgi:predicted Na+-dependent transporter